jgi:hypothetical protein
MGSVMAVHIETGTMVAPGYKSCTLAHLGLVAGMYEELGIGEVIDRVVPQDEERRFVSVGQAVKAMVLNGLGFVNQRLSDTAFFPGQAYWVVAAHQAIGMTTPIKAADHLSQHTKKHRPVGIIQIDILPGVASRGYMINCIGEFNAEASALEASFRATSLTTLTQMGSPAAPP